MGAACSITSPARPRSPYSASPSSPSRDAARCPTRSRPKHASVTSARLHAYGAAIHVQQRLLLLDFRRLLLADADELADHLHVKPGGFRLGIDVLDVGGQGLALLLKPLDALDDAAQTLARNVGRLIFRRVQRHDSAPDLEKDSGDRACPRVPSMA